MEIMNSELERKLWNAADALRGNQSSEEYMHIVIGLMFLKHMSDNLDFLVNKYEKENNDTLDVNDKDDLSLIGASFVIPEKAKWSYIAQYATKPNIGSIIDQAFEVIEEANPELLGLFDKNYNQEALDQNRLGMVVSEFSNLNLQEFGEDIIGRTYEYFLGEFFKKQGQKGGEFYTPKSIVKLMVEIIDPKEGKIYDPAAGTGGMLVQARQHIIESKGNPDLLVAYGQEFQNKTWKLSRINLLLHGFQNDNIKLGVKSADTFTEDLHQGEQFDYVLANPPFNCKKWGAEKLLNEHDSRWEWGYPPKGNANYAWLSHMIHKLNSNGKGATVLANGSLSSSGKDELTIRKNFVKSNVIEAIITLPDKLFYTVGIPACIWVFNKNKKSKNILMINASDFEGEMKSKKLRILTDANIEKIIDVYKNFINGKTIEEIGFAKDVSNKEIEENDYSFVPGRYVGFVEEEINREKAQAEIKESAIELKKLFAEFENLMPQVNEAIEKALDFEIED